MSFTAMPRTLEEARNEILMWRERYYRQHVLKPEHVQEILAKFPLFDDEGLDEEEHCCEWTLQQERKRLHAIINRLAKGTQA
jgi:hypothetical protein